MPQIYDVFKVNITIDSYASLAQDLQGKPYVEEENSNQVEIQQIETVLDFIKEVEED